MGEKTEVTLPAEKPGGPSQTLDFTKKGGENPFKKAEASDRRIKAFFWGDAGSGKTVLALQFPKPVMIDLEGGSVLYRASRKFEVMDATTADEVMEAVNFLLAGNHDYRTLIIDPITIYWQALQAKYSEIFLRRNKGSKGYRFEFYDFQPKDWLTIKAELKMLVRKLIALDMNVIVTAHQKTKYKEGEMMVSAGETFDAEKGLPFMFDVIVQLYVDEKGRHFGKTIKDRSEKLPKDPFPMEYALFERMFGAEALGRKAKAVEFATDEQKEQIRTFIQSSGMTSEQVSARLADYGATTVDDLTKAKAAEIIKKISAAKK